MVEYENLCKITKNSFSGIVMLIKNKKLKKIFNKIPQIDDNLPYKNVPGITL